MQDLILTPQVIRFRRERWVTPDGEEVVAPLPPEVTGYRSLWNGPPLTGEAYKLSELIWA